MKKVLLLSLVAITTLLQADLSNSTQKQDQQSQSTKQNQQKSINQSDTRSLTQNQGSENSINKSLTDTLTNTRSITQSVNKSQTGNWSININPVPYVLMQLRNHGWDRRAFFLTNKDIGTSYSYADADDDEEVIDLNKKAYYEAKASTRGNMQRSQVVKLQEIITLLNYTGAIADKAISYMNKYNNPDSTDIENLAYAALKKAVQEVPAKRVDIQQCSYGGNNDTYTCNNGEYTISLTNSVPTLLKNGVPYYSAERIGFSTPSLTLSFATSTSEAMSKLMQDSQSRAVAQAVRDYTSRLKSQGQSDTASKIESAFVEKALTTNVSNTATATVQAINSGSPTAVLKIFQ